MMTTPAGATSSSTWSSARCRNGDSLTKQDQNGVSYTFPGAIGVAPELKNGPCDVACQERVSACMLAHVNNSRHEHRHLAGQRRRHRLGHQPDFPYQEGSFFGNLFPNPWQGFYCNGKGYDAGSVPAASARRWRATSTSTRTAATSSAATRVSAPRTAPTATTRATPSSNGVLKTWSKVVTVWRNFDPTPSTRSATGARRSAWASKAPAPPTTPPSRSRATRAATTRSSGCCRPRPASTRSSTSTAARRSTSAARRWCRSPTRARHRSKRRSTRWAAAASSAATRSFRRRARPASSSPRATRGRTARPRPT